MTSLTIGNATLYHGDCYEIAPCLGYFDALVTDPPYIFETSGGGRFRRDRQNMDDIIEAGLDKGFNHAIINTLLYRSSVVFCHNDQLPKLLPYLDGCYRRTALCAWHKKNPMPVANKHYLPDTEFYIHAWNEGGHPIGELTEKRRYIETNNGKSEFDHPTVKPLEVMDKIMKNVNGQTIIDPFMGTGTTGLAALKAGKTFVGIEKEQKYFDIACQRIGDFYLNK
jgi:site-specific DNA-methyltransferase (adenine-specific)